MDFKKITLLSAAVLFCSLSWLNSSAEKSHVDTVTTGIYITSIHNIDFKQKEYAITFWIWFKYKKKDFDFNKNIEVKQAKSITKSFATADTTGGRIYELMKLDCIMKDSWKTSKFPFDFQTLRLTLENSQFDSTDLVFKIDTLGDHIGSFALSGFSIPKDSFSLRVFNQPYQTAFGDESYAKPYNSYSAFSVKIGIKREAPWTLFWKVFIGMYIAFFIAYVCFFVHVESVEARFGLNVGALFAVVGNKYIIDSELPDSTAPTLVDMLHGITLMLIFTVIASTIYALKLIKEKKIDQANRFDRITSRVLLLTYIIVNVYFVTKANM